MKQLLPETIAELFPSAPDEVRAIIASLQSTARATMPEALEVFHHGALGYGATASSFDRIVYIAPQNGYVNLGFFFGTHLSDPKHVLEGSGKRMRHIKVHSLQATANPDIIPLLQDAWATGVLAVAALHRSKQNK
jgi:hypothetical protein